MNKQKLKSNKEYKRFVRFLKDENAFFEFQNEFLRQHSNSLENYVGLINRATKHYRTILNPTFIIDWTDSKNGDRFWRNLYQKYLNKFKIN